MTDAVIVEDAAESIAEIRPVETPAEPHEPRSDEKLKELQDKFRRANSDAVRFRKETEELQAKLVALSKTGEELEFTKSQAIDLEYRLKEHTAFLEERAEKLSKGNPIAEHLKDLPVIKRIAILEGISPQPSVSFDVPKEKQQAKTFSFDKL